MNPTLLTTWPPPWPVPTAAGALLLLTWAVHRAARAGDRPPTAVLVAALAAAACTAYSADTSWRYARDHLDMTDTNERAALFAAGELAQFALALLARQNLRDEEKGTPGAPGLLIWCVAGLQVVPAFSESGPWGGLIRSAFGPLLAAVLWHFAMGIDLRHHRAGATSNGMLAQINRELRERLLSHLGLSVRDRDALTITRDRWTGRAVEYAVRLDRRGNDGWAWRTSRLEEKLSTAIGRSGAASDPNRRTEVVRQLAARRTVRSLATMPVESPWLPELPPARPSTPAALARQALTGMRPYDALTLVHRAHPDADAAHLAALLTEHGVIVTESNVAQALPHLRLASGAPRVHAKVRPPVHPEPEVQHAPTAPPLGAHGLVLDVRTAPEVHPEMRTRAVAAATTSGPRITVRLTNPDPGEQPKTPETAEPDVPADLAPLLDRARALGQPASLRTLKRTFGIGQKRAQELQALTKRGE